MRTGRCKRCECIQASRAACAPRIRHHRIEDLPGDIVVVSAEDLTGCSAALDDSSTRLHIYKVKSVRRGLRHRIVGSDEMLKHVLNCRIAHTSVQRRRGDGDCAGHASVPNRLSRHVVFGQLINERARHNVVKEPIDLWDQVTGGSMLPPCPPKDCENFNILAGRTSASTCREVTAQRPASARGRAAKYCRRRRPPQRGYPKDLYADIYESDERPPLSSNQVKRPASPSSHVPPILAGPHLRRELRCPRDVRMDPG